MRAFKILLGILAAIIGLTVLGLSAMPAAAQPGKLDLTLYIAGPYPDPVTPGQDNHLFVTIRNNSNSPITHILFRSDAPEGWTVTFDPPGLDSLTENSSNTIDVNIVPPKSVENRDYNVTLIAEAAETRAVTSAYLRVEGGISYWLWIGIGIAVAVIIGFIIVFFRFGR